MSPVSRSRKPKKGKKPARRSAPVSPVEPCDCPACSDENVDLSVVVDGILADASDLVVVADPLEAEFGAAMFVAMGELAGDGFEDAMVDGFVPEFESRADTPALIMLSAFGSVCDGRVGKAATAAADRLVAAGVTPPGWAAELEQAPTAGDCWRLADPEGTGSSLIGTFHRAGRSHAFMVSVDHTDCGAATNIMLLDAAELPQALDVLQRSEIAVDKQPLDPAELRWHVECALDARAAHDAEVGAFPFAGDGPPEYHILAVLLRARLRTLPDSGKPKPAHASEPRPLPGLLDRLRPRALPKRRTGPADVYQLKVGLRGAKPPIWRRLEVRSDTTLAQLHWIIQVAFGWDDSHLHVFETPYGDFGIPDAELGHHPADSVTLQQVLTNQRDRLTYTYDFGDDWRHDITLEKILDPDPSVTYPRCTAGRRATPPEDCGGIWGYAYLLDVLADPSHPEHEDRLEWLGLDTAADFDPATFDSAAVTQALARLP
jgi:hypothetical protein